jgi:DNA-binding CsgD family transcriptional regulator
MSQLAPALTRQQRWVLDRVALGMSNKEIAQALGISPRTVEIHRAKALTCIGARNTVHAAVIWDRALRGDGRHASIAQVLAGAMKVHRLASRVTELGEEASTDLLVRVTEARAQLLEAVLKAFPDFPSEMEQ